MTEFSFFSIFDLHLNNLISSKPLTSNLIIDQCICKRSDMSACYPCLWMSNNGCVHIDDIITIGGKMLHPEVRNILFEQ